ncbi:hemolysin family protein [Planctomycetota bacterium]|nr:hemolysin family protein [Planctomycetota bacterium]
MDPVSVLIFLGILTLSGLFSGTETALTAVSDVKIHQAASDGDNRAKLLEKILTNRGRVIAALLVGNNVVNVALAVYATVIFNDTFIGTGIPEWAAPIIASVASVLFLLVFGEVLPKSIAVAFSIQWSLSSAYPVAVLMAFTLPVTAVLNYLSNGVMVVMGRKQRDNDIFDIREIHTMAHLQEQAGVIDPLEKQLIQRASQLNDTRVREIMIPRTDVQALAMESDLKTIHELFGKTPYSRIPVFERDLDNIQGLLNFKELLRHDPSVREFDLKTFLHKPLYVPESMFIGDLLNEMRRKRTHMAIVLDEYGGTSGLTTLEDVMEMLVGRIDDEYDIVTTPLRPLEDGSWVVDGRLSDERLFAAIAFTMDAEAQEGFDTAAGLALKAFENIPSEGETTTYHGLEITALKVKDHRVRRIRVRKLSDTELVTQEAVDDAARSIRKRATRDTTGPIRKTDTKE